MPKTKHFSDKYIRDTMGNYPHHRQHEVKNWKARVWVLTRKYHLNHGKNVHVVTITIIDLCNGKKPLINASKAWQGNTNRLSGLAIATALEGLIGQGISADNVQVNTNSSQIVSNVISNLAIAHASAANVSKAKNYYARILLSSAILGNTCFTYLEPETAPWTFMDNLGKRIAAGTLAAAEVNNV